MPATARSWKTLGKPALKGVLTILVLVFVGRHVARTWRDLLDRGQTVWVEPAWVAASAGLYLAGLCAFGAFFWRILEAGTTPTRSAPTCSPTRLPPRTSPPPRSPPCARARAQPVPAAWCEGPVTRRSRCPPPDRPRTDHRLDRSGAEPVT